MQQASPKKAWHKESMIHVLATALQMTTILTTPNILTASATEITLAAPELSIYLMMCQNLSTTSMPISQSYSMTTTLTATFAIPPAAIF
jgi:hypothetical protein